MKHLLLVPLQFLAVLAFLYLVGTCTKVEKTIIQTDPPRPDEIMGSYSVQWPGFVGMAEISAHLELVGLPCLLVTGVGQIGGTYDYTLAGRLTAEMKAPGGQVKLLLDGVFSHDLSLRGDYSIWSSGSECDSGPVKFTKL